MYHVSHLSTPFGQLTPRAMNRWKGRPKHIYHSTDRLVQIPNDVLHLAQRLCLYRCPTPSGRFLFALKPALVGPATSARVKCWSAPRPVRGSSAGRPRDLTAAE